MEVKDPMKLRSVLRDNISEELARNLVNLYCTELHEGNLNNNEDIIFSISKEPFFKTGLFKTIVKIEGKPNSKFDLLLDRDDFEGRIILISDETQIILRVIAEG